MLSRIVGKVTDEERKEIKALFYRKASLEELFKTLLTSQIEVKNNEIYEKLVKDYGDTTFAFQNWWTERSNQYTWESKDGGNWTINFETGDIILNYQE
jgi:CXXX repeat modification system protein